MNVLIQNSAQDMTAVVVETLKVVLQMLEGSFNMQVRLLYSYTSISLCMLKLLWCRSCTVHMLFFCSIVIVVRSMTAASDP
jgi:hypothetical protein